MGRDGIHSPDDILDAARDVVLERGVSGATTRAIAEAAGAPTGSIYHRFGSRDGVLANMWIRAVQRSQRAYLDAIAVQTDPVEGAVGAALSIFDFARHERKDAQIVVLFRREDLIREAPKGLAEPLRTLNEPVLRAIRQLHDAMSGCPPPSGGALSFDTLLLAVFDLPYGATRRYLVRGNAPPRTIRPALELAIRAVLPPSTIKP
ncbi:TetR/AcrR family transcriptional regulator [Pendulispora albinea]|uniref:TetR/AcrR family transcriptional regulator n=1 Tax=Pendulispora albinea TaxID=2741071 RepID=A0ABZ2LSK6_9BACT